jgi:hypothetical protein
MVMMEGALVECSAVLRSPRKIGEDVLNRDIDAVFLDKTISIFKRTRNKRKGLTARIFSPTIAAFSFITLEGRQWINTLHIGTAGSPLTDQ